MPGRKVGRGPSKPSKTKSPKAVKVKVKVPKPVKVKPGKATPTPRFVAPPLPPPKTAPRPPPKTPLTLPQRVQIGPRKSASSPWLRTTSSSHSLKPSSKPPFLSNPSAHYPPTPNKFPASPHASKLKPSRSVPNFAGVRADGKSTGVLKPSKSSETLKKQSRGPFESNRPPVPASTFNSKLGQDPRLVQSQSSSKIKSTNPAVRGEKATVKKPGFLSRLFGIGGSSKSKYPEGPKLPQPPKPLKKPASTPHLAPNRIPKSNTVATASPIVKPSRFTGLSTITTPSSTSGRLGVKPVINKQPIQPHVAAMDHRDRNHLTRPLKPKYEPTVDYGRQHYDYDTTYTHVPSDYDLHYGTSGYYGADQSTTYAGGGYPDTTITHDSGYQSTNNSTSYTPCTVCNVNPQYVDPNTGQVSPYCSDICQAAANPQPQQALCTVCQAHPQYADPNTGTTYAYCSQGCQAAEAVSQQAQYSQQQQVTATCNYPGCTSPATLYPHGSNWNYCGQSHQFYASEGCIYCRQAEQFGANPLCTACDHTLSQYAPMLVQVPLDNKLFWDVTDQFTEQWSHPTKCPTVQAVYRVIGSQQSWNAYHAYRNQLEYYGQFVAQGKIIGNECLLWHGTGRVCNLGDSGNTTPCANPGCALCSIICGSFDITKVATNTGRMRFGAGIYTSTRSSKANDYSRNICSSSYKVMLLNTVAVGKAYETYHNKPTLVCPPKGRNSVYGKPGVDLKYDEVVVYTNDAIRPSWLVLYG